MTGRPSFNYPAFHAAAGRLRSAGYEALCPTAGEQPPSPDEALPWQHYMRLGLRLLLDAEGVALLPEWEASRGATLEVHLARALDMPIRPVDEWLRGAA